MKIILILSVVILTIKKLKYVIYFNLAVGRIRFNIHKFLNRKNKQMLSDEDKIRHQKNIAWLAGQDMEKMSLESEDGLMLSGYYLEADNPKRTIFLFHGWRGSWRWDFADHAKVFHENNCNLLFVDQRAHGASDGKYIGFGVLEQKDCLSWIKKIKQLKKQDIPCYLMGVSMGAATVMMASNQVEEKDISGIIADSGFVSPYDMVNIFAHDMMKMKDKTAVDQVNRICVKKAGYDLKQCRTTDSLRNCRVPILFVHGSSDKFVPAQRSIQNYDSCASQKDILLIQGAEHCKSFLKDENGYIEKLNTFFGWNLQKIPG